MIFSILKFSIILVLIVNQILLINKNRCNSNLIILKKKGFNKKNIYKELLELYFENKKKFYAKGREYIMNKKKNFFNERNVKTFQEKLNYLLIYESPENKTQIVDKILLRQYSKKILGKDICAPIFKIYNNIHEINLDELPEKFVLKCNHGSAMNIFCKDKNNFNFTHAKIKLKKWMKINYGLFRFEYQYLNIKRRVFAEQFLGNELVNYKFSCFNGVPQFIRVKKQINGTKLYNIYYTNWTISNIELDNKKYILSNRFKKPKGLFKMIKYAKLLSSQFCFCRVDFYEVNDKIYLSEITFTPFNSYVRYKKKETEIYLGNLINIKKIKKLQRL